MSYAPQNNQPIMNPAAPPQGVPAQAPAPDPLAQFPPLYEQGRINVIEQQPDPSQGLAQFAQPQPPVNPLAGVYYQQQGMAPQPAPITPPPMTVDPVPMPQIDQNLLNDAVVAERLRSVELQYAAAYQQTDNPQVQQAILLAYHGEKARMEASVELARIQMERYQMQVAQQQQRVASEPMARVMAAQVLAQRLGIPEQLVPNILKDPAGNEIWDPKTMILNAQYVQQLYARGNIQQAAGQAISPIATGGQQGSGDLAAFTRSASREDFMRLVNQAKRAGVRLSMAG